MIFVDVALFRPFGNKVFVYNLRNCLMNKFLCVRECRLQISRCYVVGPCVIWDVSMDIGPPFSEVSISGDAESKRL